MYRFVCIHVIVSAMNNDMSVFMAMTLHEHVFQVIIRAESVTSHAWAKHARIAGPFIDV